jgi:hypothetical protein
MSSFKDTVQKITESPFFTFSRPPLEFIAKAKLFKIVFTLVCVVMAVITLIHPFVILFRVINSGYFNFGIKYILAFIFIWLAVLAACWLGFHLWLERRKKSEAFGSSEFIALPFFAELLKTFGEWLGILYGVIGAVGGLFSLIFLGRYSGSTLAAIISGAKSGAAFGGDSEGLLAPLLGGLIGKINGMTSFVFTGAIILGPIVGVIIVLVSRLCAERLRVLAAIADNTKKS